MKITIIEDFYIPNIDVLKFRIQCDDPIDKYKSFFTNDNIYLKHKVISYHFYDDLTLPLIKKLKHKDKLWAVQNLQSNDLTYKLLSNLIIDDMEIEWLIPEKHYCDINLL